MPNTVKATNNRQAATDELSEFSRMQEDIEEAKERWLNFFDTAMHALLDYDTSELDIARRVAACTTAADAALAAFEERWTRPRGAPTLRKD